jgi:hypothetical protein
MTMTTPTVENSSVPSIPLNAGQPRVAAVGGAAHALDDVDGLLPAVAAEVERDDRLECLPVTGRERSLYLPLYALDTGERLGVGLGLREVRTGQPGLALVHDHGRDLVGVLEGVQLVEGARRLGAAREPRDRVVLLHARQLLGAARGDTDDQQPEDQRHPLGVLVRECSGEPDLHCAPSQRRSFKRR